MVACLAAPLPLPTAQDSQTCLQTLLNLISPEGSSPLPLLRTTELPGSESQSDRETDMVAVLCTPEAAVRASWGTVWTMPLFPHRTAFLSHQQRPTRVGGGGFITGFFQTHVLPPLSPSAL